MTTDNSGFKVKFSFKNDIMIVINKVVCTFVSFGPHLHNLIVFFLQEMSYYQAW